MNNKNTNTKPIIKHNLVTQERTESQYTFLKVIK